MIRADIAGRPITLAIMQTAADASIIQRLRNVFESELVVPAACAGTTNNCARTKMTIIFLMVDSPL